MICKRLSSAFEFFEDALDGIPIPVGDVLESERVAMAGFLESLSTIDGNHSVFDIVFLA
jgi:hypothetical protein